MKTDSRATEIVETIATFGLGRLVKTRSGQYRFEGGTHRDVIEAREWASMFFPELVFAARSDVWSN